MFVLEEIYKSKKAGNSDQFNLRIQRSLGWFKKATLLDDDLDLKLISLWISFKAIYLQESDVQNLKESTQKKQNVKQFLSKILQSDQEHKIYPLIWEKLSQAIVGTIENPYAFQPFWEYQNQEISQTAWKDAFEIEKKQVQQVVQTKDTLTLLCMIFNRLETIQKQILNGGSTYNSAMNRKQLQDACNILSAILPTLIYIILENPIIFEFNKPYYPVLQMS
ncbi:HEPN domain-containing protein [uncultured Acinetobacter sp.]|uniref:HEPN domain-containing protein n=1 Tax=uncultured Acinetobacter sp. TaxID=165433 RepID=UPI0025DDB154|nr:HEPN domain-containing protein [uncultured Acinetobacter sp.]